MYTTQASGKQTGQVSRITNPRASLAATALQARIQAGTNPSEPIRNELRGANMGSWFSRVLDWFRGR
jgi:hypothetical protein